MTTIDLITPNQSLDLEELDDEQEIHQEREEADNSTGSTMAPGQENKPEGQDEKLGNGEGSVDVQKLMKLLEEANRKIDALQLEVAEHKKANTSKEDAQDLTNVNSSVSTSGAPTFTPTLNSTMSGPPPPSQHSGQSIAQMSATSPQQSTFSNASSINAYSAAGCSFWPPQTTMPHASNTFLTISSRAPIPSYAAYGYPSMASLPPGAGQHINANVSAIGNVNGQLPIERAVNHGRRHELPSFNGRPEDWPKFYSSFHMTTQLYGYSDLENLLRLQHSLTGDALRTVESMLIHPQHIGHVMATLEEFFGRPEQLLRSQLNLARELPKLDDAHLDQIVNHSIVVKNLATYLDSEATQHYLADPTLLEELTSKLPMNRRLEWAAVAITIRPHPTLRHYANWISGVARLVNMVTEPVTYVAKSTRDNTRTSTARGRHVLLSMEKCTFCGRGHNVRKCEELLTLSIPERLREIKKRPLCFGCLSDDHLLPTCEKKKQCGIDGCNYWHVPELHQPNATLLPSRDAAERDQTEREQQEANSRVSSKPTFKKHRPNRNHLSRNQDASGRPTGSSTSSSSNEPKEKRQSDSLRVLSCSEGPCLERTLLFRVVPVTLYGANRTVHTFALLDEGSSISMIDSDLANELELEGSMSDLSVQWFGKQSTIVRSRNVALSIRGEQEKAQRFNLCNVKTVPNLMLPTQSISNSIISSNPHLRDIPFSSYKNAQPKILLGLDHHHLGVPRQVRTGPEDSGVVAVDTKIGWVVYGSDGQTALPRAVVMHVNGDTTQTDADLHELVRQHFTTEDFGVKLPANAIESDEVVRARQILKATTKRIGSRFETGLLWRNDVVTLPESYNMALRRLGSIESKMRRDPEYARQYRSQIASYIAKGYARELTQEEASLQTSRTWYLPHFAVSSISKPGKFRLVFDAAATVNGVSLNSELLTGPDVNVPLARLLFQFRISPVAVCGDIREMFHQVLVPRQDQDSQRFIWRDGDSSVRPTVYAMQVMTFGATCSPASAQHVKNANAIDFAHELPEAAEAIQKRHYVDDYVASYATPEDAIRITQDVIEIHRRGGFELRGIVSNNEKLRQHFGDPDKTVVQLEHEPSNQKILGMNWETTDDTFRFLTKFGRVPPNVIDGTKVPSKREILSFSMSIFDPFGILADFVLESKLILQDLWRVGIGWDEPVSDTINERWQAWRTQIQMTQLVRVPRCYSPHFQTTPDLQLHIFADASEDAFAAVAYWRIRIDERTEISFVAGKARCAPIKILSIPRLELQAAVLATRLMNEIKESHDIPITKTVLWSDSETVLKWLHSDQRQYKPFVAFRVAEIVESAPASWWRWVPTTLNVADDATRVRHPLQFDPESRWIRGPAWLREKEEHWPVQTTTNVAASDTNEVRGKFVGVITQKKPIEYERFSRLYRISRTIAWVLRFITNTKAKPMDRKIGELGSDEVNKATETLCRWVQAESYSSERSILESGGDLPQDSRIFILKPYLDESGLLRVHGRTDAANEKFLPREMKRPIVLPNNHYFTKLVVRHHHERMAHQLVDATIASVRGRYWVPRLRALVRQIYMECQACRIRKAKPNIPIQGQIPLDRMDAYARPFTNTGMDYFGPVAVTVGRHHEKRWVALFTCLTVRAVHLEIAADLSTDACLTCIRNLCNLRGVPSLIRCDNGTNFVGARTELAKEKKFFDPDAIQRDLTTKGILWRFNCPANPEAGGAWERLVQSVKRVLAVTLHEAAPRVETLRALLLEAANIVNSRPLTHLEVDPNDPEPITPNHFLIGGQNAATVPDPMEVELKCTRKQWQICRGLSRNFWRTWIKDYLPEMTLRNKHYPRQAPLMVGDLVVVCDENQSHGRWKRGKIEAVAVGPDGEVRTATVRTSDGSIRRPTTKLAKLIVSSSPIESTNGGRDVAISRRMATATGHVNA